MSFWRRPGKSVKKWVDNPYKIVQGAVPFGLDDPDIQEKITKIGLTMFGLPPQLAPDAQGDWAWEDDYGAGTTDAVIGFGSNLLGGGGFGGGTGGGTGMPSSGGSSGINIGGVEIPQWVLSMGQTALQGYLGDKAAKEGKKAAGLADPFSSYRPAFAGKLAELYADPSKLSTMPGYQFRLQEGLSAIDRGASRAGNLGSGRRLLELQRYGQNLASQEFGDEMQRLMQLSGATTGSPGAAGQLRLEGAGQQIGQYQQGISDIFRTLGQGQQQPVSTPTWGGF